MLAGSAWELEHLPEEENERAEEKLAFLEEQRAPMINDDESDKIIVSAYHYADALQDHIWTYLGFQINHHLVQHFKDNIKTFPRIILEFD